MKGRIVTADDARNKIKSYRDVKRVIDNYGRNSLEYINDMTLVLKYADVSILSDIQKSINHHKFDYLKLYKKSFIVNSIRERKGKDKTD